MLLHFLILYAPFMKAIFRVTPLNYTEWKAVFLFSFPVIFLDEILKFVTRNFIQPVVAETGESFFYINIKIKLCTLVHFYKMSSDWCKFPFLEMFYKETALFY